MMNDRTFPIPSNTISVKFEDYTCLLYTSDAADD